LPTAQALHGAHEAALTVVEYVPDAHAEHVRLLVAVPALAT
jgi:hypothetical protein